MVGSRGGLQLVVEGNQRTPRTIHRLALVQGEVGLVVGGRDQWVDVFALALDCILEAQSISDFGNETTVC